MTERAYTIGEASRLSGVSVRRLRFYADEGLLPPSARTESGYRVFSDTDLVKLDLISALREAGLGLDAIRRVLSRRLSLRDALALRLTQLEAHIAAQRRIAAALRAAMRSEQPTDDDLRRLWAVTNLSHADRRAKIARFYDEAAKSAHDNPHYEEWKQQAVDSSVPPLPDDPTPEQIDAWIELESIIADQSFIAKMRKNIERIWTDDFDPVPYKKASEAVVARVKKAIEDGSTADSDVGRTIAHDWLRDSARAMNRPADEEFRRWMLKSYSDEDPRPQRYWELVAILKGQSPDQSPNREWRWIIEAIRTHLA